MVRLNRKFYLEWDPIMNHFHVPVQTQSRAPVRTVRIEGLSSINNAEKNCSQENNGTM